MAGIYLHIPFCKRACVYCNFHFSTTVNLKGQLVEALATELEMRKEFFGAPTEIDTIYFGGGTPSLLSKAELEVLFESIFANYRVASNAEITLEANPDDLDNATLDLLRQSPINRLSIGIQSFVERDLRFMQRVHTVVEAVDSVRNAQEAGFDNINVDLIYGLPNQTIGEWYAHLVKVGDLDVQHLSAYQLTVEPGTVLAHKLAKLDVSLPPEELVVQQFQQLTSWARTADFEHYEISNLARPGRQARHNTNYWRGNPYLGIGPSAHSYGGNVRSWNIAHNPRYIRALVDRKPPPWESEPLSQGDRYNELVMTGLRMSAGCSIAHIERLGREFASHFQRNINPYLVSGQAVRHGDTVTLSDSGRLIADRIASDCFYTT